MPVPLQVARRDRRPRVVLVHGFTQTGASWAGIAGELEAEFEVVTPELPGHGRAPLPRPGSGLAEAAHFLGETGGRSGYVGYSLGARCCLHLALDSPELVERLVLVGVQPGIVDEKERELRRQADDRLADALEAGGDAAVPAFIETWLAGPLFAHLNERQADRPARLSNRAAGLAASLRTAGTGTQAPLWDRLAELEMPVLVVVGADDAKFRPVAEATTELIGANARLAVMAGCGHAACFERPDAFVALLREFLGTSA